MPNSPRIAVVVETSKSFGRGLLHGVGQYARLHTRWSLFFEERALDDPMPAWVAPGGCDGIILRTRDRAQAQKVLRLGIPTVCVGEDNPPGAPAIRCDDARAAVLAAEHLLERNYKQFGFVGIRDHVWSDARREAFAATVRAAGYSCDVLEPAEKGSGPVRWDRVSGLLAGWVRRLPRPTGVLCCYDVAAMAMLNVCRELRVSVPEEVAVIGVDNDEALADLADPPLTSVAPDTARIGREAAAMLERLMAGEPANPPPPVAPLGVVARRSTDSLAIGDPEVAVALGFIRRHACDGVSIDDVLARVSLSRRTLERRFLDEVGRPMLAELNRVRFERVRALLAESDLKLESIAARAGFASAPYMIDQFGKRFGQTPGEYRAAARVAAAEGVTQTRRGTPETGIAAGRRGN